MSQKPTRLLLIIAIAVICAAAQAQVTVTAVCSPKEGWMADGWGNCKFTFKNNGQTEAKITKWAAHWEVAGKTIGDPWDGEFLLTIPAGKEAVKEETGWLPPEVVEKSKPNNSLMVGKFTVQIDGKDTEVPFKLEVPEAKLPGPTKLIKGKKVGLELMTSKLDNFHSQKKITRWLDQCYNAMYDLTGQKPDNGKLIVIKESPAHPWWAYAGNPIIMNTNYVANTLKEIDDGLMPFGWVHEIGHDFDVLGKWYIWNGPSAEWQANWKLVYAYEAISDRDFKAKWGQNKDAGYQPAAKEVFINGKQFVDSFFLFFGDPYLSNPTRTWDTMSSDEMHSFFQRLVRVYGWEPFKGWYRTYDRFEKLGLKEPDTPEGKIQLIAAILSNQTGVDLVPVFQRWRMPVTEDDVKAMMEKYPVITEAAKP